MMQSKVNLTNVMLLDERVELYGNDTVLIQKLGRLLLVADSLLGGVSVYAINTSDIPINAFQVQKLRDECLLGKKTFKMAFGIHDRNLSKEPDVTFQKAMDGSFTIKFKLDLIDLDKPGGGVYNALSKEMKTDLANVKDGDDGGGHDEDTYSSGSSWWVRANTFIELVKMRLPTVKVLLHINSNHALSKMTASGFDLVINISKAGCMVDHIPHFWEVYYDISVTGIEYNPIILRLPKEMLRPIKVTSIQ